MLPLRSYDHPIPRPLGLPDRPRRVAFYISPHRARGGLAARLTMIVDSGVGGTVNGAVDGQGESGP